MVSEGSHLTHIHKCTCGWTLVMELMETVRSGLVQVLARGAQGLSGAGGTVVPNYEDDVGRRGDREPGGPARSSWLVSLQMWCPPVSVRRGLLQPQGSLFCSGALKDFKRSRVFRIKPLFPQLVCLDTY